jgi:hypothetical protein
MNCHRRRSATVQVLPQLDVGHSGLEVPCRHSAEEGKQTVRERIMRVVGKNRNDDNQVLNARHRRAVARPRRHAVKSPQPIN